MPIDRQTLLRGPGYITVGAAAIHSTDNIVATLVTEWSDKLVSGYGRIGRSLVDRRLEITATPAMWNDLSVLFPYAAAQVEDTLFGAVDVPLTIIPRNGKDLVVANAAITTLANLAFAAEAAVFSSPITWTGLVANNTDAGEIANYYTRGTTRANHALPGFDASKVKRGRYTATRDEVTLKSETGFAAQFALSTTPDKPNGEPTVNYRLASLEAAVRCRPVGMTEEDYDALINDVAGIGDDPTTHALVIAGAGSGKPTFTLNGTHVEASGFEWGGATRTGEVTFQSIRATSSNLLAALWSIGSTA